MAVVPSRGTLKLILHPLSLNIPRCPPTDIQKQHYHTENATVNDSEIFDGLFL
jgi:hypothetical protein